MLKIDEQLEYAKLLETLTEGNPTMNTEQKIDAILSAVESLPAVLKELDDKLQVVVAGIGRLETAVPAPVVAGEAVTFSAHAPDFSPLAAAIAVIGADLAALKAEFTTPAPETVGEVPNAPAAVTEELATSEDTAKAE